MLHGEVRDIANNMTAMKLHGELCDNEDTTSEAKCLVSINTALAYIADPIQQ